MKMKKMMKSNIGLLIISAMTFQCSNEPKKGEQMKMSEDEKVVTLTVAQIKHAEIIIGEPIVLKMSTTIKVNGVVDVAPANRVYVSNPFGGFIKSMKLLPGTYVKRGDVLVVMEDPQYIQMQQDYLMAKSRLEFLALDYKRQEDLNTDKSISDKSFQQTSSEYTSQKILVKSFYEKLKLININPESLNEDNITREVYIYSPIQGYVSAANASIGKYVNSTEALFELTDEKSLHASLTVFEKDVNSVSVGQKLKITTSSRPNKQYTATVHAINRSLSTDRSSEVHCDFDISDKELFPGMFVNAELSINTEETQAVPEEAIVSWDNKRFVFAKTNTDQFEMIPIDIGKASDGYVEVITDLKDKKLVMKNAYSLLMKLKTSED